MGRLRCYFDVDRGLHLNNHHYPGQPVHRSLLRHGQDQSLYDEWAHKAADTNLSDGMDMAQVVASLRATREIALELALATAADAVAAGHFEDAADAYLKAPQIPPHASLASMSRSDISRLGTASDEGSTAMSAGIAALNDSSIPFC